MNYSMSELNTEKLLDKFFNASPEITGRQQSDITGLIGQYAHGNEPSHHIAYLYNIKGSSYKSQFYINKIINEFYLNQPDGLIGNEDCGQMSAWYILSTIGLYQITPVEPHYSFGSLSFDQVKINFEVTGEPAGKQVAPLLFLLLVENGFKHGIKGDTEGAFIHIQLQVVDNQ